VIVAGDFNTFGGDREVQLFWAATGLMNANLEGLPHIRAMLQNGILILFFIVRN